MFPGDAHCHLKRQKVFLKLGSHNSALGMLPNRTLKEIPGLIQEQPIAKPEGFADLFKFTLLLFPLR